MLIIKEQRGRCGRCRMKSHFWLRAAVTQLALWIRVETALARRLGLLLILINGAWSGKAILDWFWLPVQIPPIIVRIIGGAGACTAPLLCAIFKVELVFATEKKTIRTKNIPVRTIVFSLEFLEIFRGNIDTIEKKASGPSWADRAQLVTCSHVFTKKYRVTFIPDPVFKNKLIHWYNWTKNFRFTYLIPSLDLIRLMWRFEHDFAVFGSISDW